MEKRTIGETIENTLVLIFSLLGILSFWSWVLSLPIMPEKVAYEATGLALGLIALVILEKLYRKYKDGAVLVVIIILVLFLIHRVVGGFP